MWLVMENGRRLYAHVIGLPYFTYFPGKAQEPSKAASNDNN